MIPSQSHQFTCPTTWPWKSFLVHPTDAVKVKKNGNVKTNTTNTVRGLAPGPCVPRPHSAERRRFMGDLKRGVGSQEEEFRYRRGHSRDTDR